MRSLCFYGHSRSLILYESRARMRLLIPFSTLVNNTNLHSILQRWRSRIIAFKKMPVRIRTHPR